MTYAVPSRDRTHHITCNCKGIVTTATRGVACLMLDVWCCMFDLWSVMLHVCCLHVWCRVHWTRFVAVLLWDFVAACKIIGIFGMLPFPELLQGIWTLGSDDGCKLGEKSIDKVLLSALQVLMNSCQDWPRIWRTCLGGHGVFWSIHQHMHITCTVSTWYSHTATHSTCTVLACACRVLAASSEWGLYVRGPLRPWEFMTVYVRRPLHPYGGSR